MASSQGEEPARTPQNWAGTPALTPQQSPGTNILVVQRLFFTVGQDLPRDLLEHRVRNVQGGIVRLLVQKEPSTSDQLRK